MLRKVVNILNVKAWRNETAFHWKEWETYAINETGSWQSGLGCGAGADGTTQFSVVTESLC